MWNLKILAIKRWFPFIFAKVLWGRHFVVGGPKNVKGKNFTWYLFYCSFQKIVLSGLLLFSCAFYKVDLDYIQWNEVVTSVACNFNNSWLLYLHFSINFDKHLLTYLNIWFKTSAIFIVKKEPPKNTNI